MGEFVWEVVNQEPIWGHVKAKMPITYPRSAVELVDICVRV